MKLGVFTPVYNNISFEEALKRLSEKGVEAVEVGAGGYPGKAHLDPKKLLGNEEEINKIKELLNKYNIELSAISCHGNPVHPNKETAKEFDDMFTDAILLAEQMGVKTIIGFSGCPGDSENSKYSNWVTCAWPEDFPAILDYQWNEVLIPYWKQKVEFAKAHGIEKIALEMHPGFCVYNPGTLLKLREAVGDIIGANFDPSHLYWQGIRPSAAIKALKGAIYHFHAKDTKIDPENCAVNGVLDSTSYKDVINRSWVFRTVGYGHGQEEWNDIISTLKAVGYDGIISIEHEDALMSQEEGLNKAVDCLKNVLIKESLENVWWA